MPDGALGLGDGEQGDDGEDGGDATSPMRPDVLNVWVTTTYGEADERWRR